jgi:hypothetical protein
MTGVGVLVHSAKTLGGGLGELRNIRLDKAFPYEIDGGVRKKTNRLKCKAEPGAITVRVPREEGR